MGSMGDQNLASEPAARSDARDSAKTNGSEANFEKNATRHVARRGARRCLLTASLVACLVALLIVPVPVIAASSPETRRWADPNEVKAGEASETQREEIRSFFSSLDADGDGQVRGDELGAYVASNVGGKDFDTDVEVADAVRAVQERIDGQDTGDAIDAEELMVSLTSTKNQMLRPHQVARWIRHGLNFPQYAERFMSHGITLLDFPALLTDDGAALREELGVESALHRAKLTRALKRQLLQLGRSPGEPTDVRVAVVAEDAVVVKWRPPRKHGHPPVHAYAVQVREPGSHEWRVVGTAPHEDEDEEASAKALVTPTREMAAAAHAAGVGNGRSVPLRFRVVAWGGHGGGVSDESASVEMKPLQRSRREEVRGDGRVESDLIPAGNSIVAGSNPRDAGWSATLLGSLYSALGTFLVTAGIATRFALNGASFIATRGVQFLRGRPKPRREVAADSGAHEPPSRTDEATADGDEDRASPPPSPPVPSHPNGGGTAGGGRGLASPQPRYDRARVLESAMAAAVAAGVADASDEAILSSPSVAVVNGATNGATNGSYSANGSFCASDDDDTAGDTADEVDVAPVVCGLSSEPKKKGRCCVVGCNARWDRWSSMGDFRMMYQKHYCGLCQRAYCQAHTRVSPHGTKGRCDPESKCYCVVCWDGLNAATREALEATNRLPRREPTSGSATPDSRKRAKTRWRSVLNYKLRTPSRAENLNLMDEDLDGE